MNRKGSGKTGPTPAAPCAGSTRGRRAEALHGTTQIETRYPSKSAEKSPVTFHSLER